MKNSLLLLTGFAALSLASCSQTSTTDTTTATGTPTDTTAMATATTTTKHTMTDADYHMRGDRMAMKFASANKISDQAMMDKLKTAYYERAKRYDMMMDKYQADTAGMGAARRQYMMDTDKDFKTILVVPAQYQSYQSSMSDYDESNNMDMTEQGAASGGNMSSDNGTMSNGSASGDMSSSASSSGDMSGGAGVEKSKSKMADGSKVKVKEDGTVKMKDGDGGKTKM